jgi:outer membrane protein OmpA-like peptidoglycan-associated protein
MKLLTLISSVVIAAAASLAMTPASAQEGDLKVRAKAYVADGLTAQDEGKFEKAIVLYQQAYALVPHPAILFNIGQALRLSGDKVRAVEYYRKCYAVEGKSRLGKEAKAWVGKLQKQISEEQRVLAAKAADTVEESPRASPGPSLPSSSPKAPSLAGAAAETISARPSTQRVTSTSSATTTPPPAPAEARPPDADPDGDKVFAPADACPFAAEDPDGFQDSDGCPDPDNDRDGILDGADRCPLNAETYNGYADADGCPDPHHPDMTAIVFKHTSFSLEGLAVTSLEAVYSAMKSNSSIRVQIDGYISAGEESYLGDRRAQTVKEYLVHRGIGAQRLLVRGNGAIEPAAMETSESAQATLRRVEFVLVPLAAGRD